MILGAPHTATGVTANSEKPAGSGLPLLDQIIQITHGPWVSATGA